MDFAHARKTSGGDPEATSVEEVMLKKKDPLVGLMIGAAWTTTGWGLARGRPAEPTARARSA